MIGAALGYGVTLCVPANITPERKRILAAYGPELIFTDPLEGSDGAIREARRRFADDPQRYFYADQYNNDFNWRAHYDTTAVEIWEQTERPGHALRRRPRNQRHVRRHGPAAARAQSPVIRWRRSSPMRRFTVSRA